MVSKKETLTIKFVHEEKIEGYLIGFDKIENTSFTLVTNIVLSTFSETVQSKMIGTSNLSMKK